MSMTLSSYARVSPAVCGVTKTLGMAQSGEAAGKGSSAVTSMAAAQVRLVVVVSIGAAASATLPRATLTKIDDGFIALNAAALIRPVVSGVRAQVSATMS